MDNQHKLIKGYRDLSQEEIDAMNSIKEEGERLKAIIDGIEAEIPEADKRWLAIARTDLQKGIMGLVRAVARPESF